MATFAQTVCVLVILAFAAGTSEAAMVQARDDKAAVNEKILLRDLSERARSWMEVRREKLWISCKPCDGKGTVVVPGPPGGFHKQQSKARETCKACSGEGRRFIEAEHRKAYFEFHTPEWQTSEGAFEAWQRSFRALRRQDSERVAPSSLLRRKVTLVDHSHGLTVIAEGKRGKEVEFEYRWVLRKQDGKTKWFLWKPSDGNWPDEQGQRDASESETESDAADEPDESDNAADSSTAREAILELEEEPRTALLAAAAAVEASWRVTAVGRVGRQLVVTLVLGDETLDPSDAKRLQRDSIAYVRALFGPEPTEPFEWDSIRLDFSGLWMDEYGNEELLPRWSVSIGTLEYRKVRWENERLDLAARWKHFTQRDREHADWTLIGDS